MGGYTAKNLKEIENQGVNFGLDENDIQLRMAKDPLECEGCGISYVMLGQGWRAPFGHTHKTQEEIYVLVNGSARMKIGDDVIDLKPFTAVRVAPDAMRSDDGELVLGGVRASAVAQEFGTPLVVYCERTLLAQAREYQRVDPEALIVYGTKAFANVALLLLFAQEGLGADVSTLGELRFALTANVPSERIVFHGNNKSDEELRAAADAGALVVLDARDEVERASVAGVDRVLV